MQRTQHLLRSTILVILIFGLNKITGFVKLLLMTAAFGASPQADAFTAANQLPELFDSMLASGALAAALIPIYSAALLKGTRTEATALANTVLTLTLLVLGGVSGVAALFALPLTQQFLVPDFAPAQQALTAELMRILLLAVLFYGVGSVFSSFLHAHQHFLMPALGTVVLDLGQAAGLYFLAPRWGIEGVAWGSVIGALLFWGVQIPIFLRRQIANRPQLALRLAELHELGYLMWPRVITLGVVQAVDLIFIRLASQLPGGSISAYAYALLIMVSMPKTLFGAAISTVVFPTLAEQHNRGDSPNLNRTMHRALQAVWALIIPGAVGLLALGEPAVAFLLQRGAFDARATTLVYTLLAIFALRLVAESTQDMLALPFYARHNTHIAMWISLGWMGLNISLSYLLVGPLGIHGLAWAATLAVVAATLTLYGLNRRVTGSFEEVRLGRSLGRILLACACMVGVILPLHWLALDMLPFLVIAMGLGGLTYLAVYAVLGGRELQTVVALLMPAHSSAKHKPLVISDPSSSRDGV
jgi:putative peptidoglycan lipid II flippase